MNKKLTTYLLLMLVAAIWGYIFYKFFGDMSGNSAAKKFFAVSADTALLACDTLEERFELIANYRDPFTGSSSPSSVAMQTNKQPSRRVKEVVKKTATTPPVFVVWPEVVYMGIISNMDSHKKIGILKINAHDHLVSVGDVFSDVQVLSFTGNHIVLSYQKQLKSFNKSGK